MGIFYDYIPHEQVKLVGVEAAGEGLTTMRHAASLQRGTPGVLHGNRTYLLQDENGQITETHSVSAGLDYPGVGPEHAWLKDSGRAEYVGATDDEALRAFHDCCRIEGIIPALESSHALAYATKLAPTLPKDKVLLVNLSGRGDKDLHIVAEASGLEFYCRASCREATLEYRPASRRSALMSRIASALRAAEGGRPQGADPVHRRRRSEPALTVPLLHALARAGADVIELGVPFSDPMADGPVIQRATERAIRHGVGLRQTLAFVAEFRTSDATTPVVLMGYANPIERMGR